MSLTHYVDPSRPIAFDGRSPAHWMLLWEEFDAPGKRWVTTFVLLANEAEGRTFRGYLANTDVRDLRMEPLVDEIPAGRQLIKRDTPPHMAYVETAGYRFERATDAVEPASVLRVVR